MDANAQQQQEQLPQVHLKTAEQIEHFAYSSANNHNKRQRTVDEDDIFNDRTKLFKKDQLQSLLCAQFPDQKQIINKLNVSTPSNAPTGYRNLSQRFVEVLKAQGLEYGRELLSGDSKKVESFRMKYKTHI